MTQDKIIDRSYYLDSDSYSVIFKPIEWDSEKIIIAVELNLLMRTEFVQAIYYKDKVCTDVIDAQNILSNDDISEYIELSYNNYEERISKNNN